MSVIKIGKRLIPTEQIALIEPYVPAANSRIKTERQFQARVILIHRDSVLTEETPEAFAETNAFRMLAEDRIATNPAVSFFVETFEPTEGFQPTKPYATRLRWRDQDGEVQSKLLLTRPETALSVAVKGQTIPDSTARGNAPRARRRRSRAPAPSTA